MAELTYLFDTEHLAPRPVTGSGWSCSVSEPVRPHLVIARRALRRISAGSRLGARFSSGETR